MRNMLFLFITILFFTHTVAAQPKLVLARIEGAPDQFFGGEILKKAYGHMGITVEIRDMPGKRALKESSAGRIDGEVQRVFAIGEYYPSLLRVATPIGYIEPSVFSNKFNFQVTDCNALKNYSIGVVRGITYAKKCTSGMPDVHVFNSPRKLLQLLNAGRLDIAIMSKKNGLWFKKQLGMTSIHLLSPSLKRLPLYHYLNKKNEKFVIKIDKVLQEMQSTGELQRIQDSALPLTANKEA